MFSLKLPVSFTELSLALTDSLIEMFGDASYGWRTEPEGGVYHFQLHRGRNPGHQLGPCGYIQVTSLGIGVCAAVLNDPPYPGHREAVFGVTLLPPDPQSRWRNPRYAFALDHRRIGTEAEMLNILTALTPEEDIAACEAAPDPNAALAACLEARLEKLQVEIHIRRRLFQFRLLRRALVRLQAERWNLQAGLDALYQEARAIVRASNLPQLLPYPRPTPRLRRKSPK